MRYSGFCSKLRAQQRDVPRSVGVEPELARAAKCARAHFTSKWSRPSHHPPQGRPTPLLRACIFYALSGEWYESAYEAKLREHVQRQAHTRTIVQPNEIPGKEIPEYAGGRRARNTKSFAKEAHTYSQTPDSRQHFFFCVPYITGWGARSAPHIVA